MHLNRFSKFSSIVRNTKTFFLPVKADQYLQYVQDKISAAFATERPDILRGR